MGRKLGLCLHLIKFMRLIYIFIVLLITGCSNKGLVKTDQKNIFSSNSKVTYDLKKNSFKIEFSINNNTKVTMTNFVYQAIFKDKNGNVITTKENFYNGAIEPGKAKRVNIFIDDYTRENYKTFDVVIKK